MSILILAPRESLGVTARTPNTYQFAGAHGRISWPKDAQAHLGPVGAWNILFRLGYLPKWVTLAELAVVDPVGKLLIISSAGQWSRAQTEQIEHWAGRGGRILAAGISPHWPEWLGFAGGQGRFEKLDHPEGAIGATWAGANDIGLWGPGEQPYLARAEKALNTEAAAYGQLFMIHGERQTPERALKTPLAAPVLWTKGNFCYLNGNIFAGFQAWLQGQSDLSPWLNWRQRLFWLDEWVGELGKLLENLQLLPARPTGLPQLGRITIIFRHDVDSSKDTSYLELEEQTGTPATYAILKDRNTRFWIKRLAEPPFIEGAFHYNTAKEGRLLNRLRSYLGGGAAYRPARAAIVEKGLWRQVQWAKKNRIGIRTLHRHASFLIYPEWIDAMDYVFQREPGVLGSSSLFRSNLLRWGTDRVDGVTGTLVHSPDVQFPLWFPFKLAHAGDHGRPLRGWESTHLVEPEPDLLSEMLGYALRSPLPRFVFTLGFHPAHANRPTFTHGGGILWVKQVMEMIRKYGCAVSSLGDLYEEITEATQG